MPSAITMTSEQINTPSSIGIKIDSTDVEHFEKVLRSRHSVRMYLPRPVPGDLLRGALEFAQTAPSNSNTQPWRLYVAQGARRDALCKTLYTHASAGEAPAIPPLPDAFRHYRSELGRDLYGRGAGLARDDKDGRKAAVLRNFNFFDAPVAMVLAMDDSLEHWDSLSVGLYLQTLLLALTARGLGACVMVSIAGYPDLCRAELGIPHNQKVLCGIAVGYPDFESEKGRSINHPYLIRDTVDQCVKFVE